MPTPTVPWRANQIPRSLPSGVGGNGFGHHPKPVSVGENDPRPSDFPMNQRRYRGAGGGQLQWDSKTETPVWREIPLGKSQNAGRQYSPSPREQYPLSHKKSRYKPGLMRTPTRPGDKTLEPRTPIPINKQNLPKTPNPAADILKDAIKHQFRVDPTGIGDSRIVDPFPPVPPWKPPTGPAGERGGATCARGLSDEAVRKLYGKLGVGKDERYLVSVEIYEIKDEVGNFICTERFECVNGKCPGGKFMTGRPYWELSRPSYSYMKYTSSRSSQQVGVVMGYGDLGGQTYISTLQELAQVYKVSLVNSQFIPSVGRMWQSNGSAFIIGIRTNSGEYPPTGQKNEISITGHVGSYGSGLRFGDHVDPKDNKGINSAVKQNLADRPPTGYTRSIGPVHICTLRPSEEQLELDPIEPDDDYDFDVDEDTEMGCKWQKDEVGYQLPELKIGDTKVGGGFIQIDDGLIPLADFVCKALEMMHKGLGLNLLGVNELPASVFKPDENKSKISSLAALTQWQFDNVGALVGLPSVQEIVTVDNAKKDFAFRNVQDALTFLYHQQRESDMDLKIIETYHAKTAQQLEAVTQIALRQTADLEMIVQELGIKWKWERKERPSLYKHGMSDDDEKTGILELFKGGTVAYPVRVWADEVDSKQVALRTNLYAEMAAQSTLTRINSGEGIPGLDARIKMKSGDEDEWKEWVKAINIPEKGTVSGVPTPYIEEYEKGSLTAKNIGAPTSALSVFMKPKKGKK